MLPLPNRPRALAILLAGLLLLIAASRIPRLHEPQMNQDEIWSVWQTLGSPAQIIRWTPYDWPPLYYLMLGAWRGLAGMHPIILRFSSVLLFLLGVAFLYRAARRLGGHQAAALSALAYAGLGYAALISLEVRGYAPALALLPLAFWLTLRYFDHPGLRRGLLLGLSLAALFYTSLTAAGALAMLGLYTLLVYRRAIWRWWLPGLTAVLLALPEIAVKAQLAITRTAATAQLSPPPLHQAFYDLFWNWAGYAFPVWVILLAAAAGLLIYRRARRPVTLALLVWAFGVPLLLYLTNPLLGFFSARYAWWVMPGLALLAGCGLAHLPRPAAAAATIILLGLLFVPVPFKEYSIFSNLSELNRNFRWLQTRLLPGDVLLADPGNQCGRPEEWDYYTRVYFPNGLTFVADPTGYRRVWHIIFDGAQDAQMQQAVARGRVSRQFVGPPGCLFRLYEAPPDAEGIPFANGMRFHGVDVLENGLPWTGPLVRREAESIHLRLWWSVDEPPAQDYSVGLYLLHWRDGLADSVDHAPQPVYPPDAPPETSRWQPGEFYIEERTLTLPFPTARTTYTIALAVYFWQDQQRITAPGANEDGLLPLLQVTVMSY